MLIGAVLLILSVIAGVVCVLSARRDVRQEQARLAATEAERLEDGYREAHERAFDAEIEEAVREADTKVLPVDRQ